ncbi:glycosyltransferase family 4 protein [Hydrogenophaga sp. MI9]|uniref:glycosyltransferase family 4 protein n=1 Tax=Hydrogenophaga sp. MI9 TaxID=3453719 RepID=UPI003EF07D92
MRVALSTIGKFHTFDLARQLHSKGFLTSIFTGYPKFKLKNEDIPQDLIHSFPWLHAPYMGFPYKHRIGKTLLEGWEYLDRISLSNFTARNLPDCDIFCGLSSSALSAGILAKSRGAKYICDRGSTHIRTQDQILREEHEIWGIPYKGIDPRIIDLEEREYDASDLITVPSNFNVDSFVRQGISRQKIKKIPYGVDLNRFEKTSSPSSDSFEVLFVGSVCLRKGIPYLLKAFKEVIHANKHLTLAGTYDQQYILWLKRNGLLNEDTTLLGPVPQERLKQIMSRSHVMVLPSIEEGLAMVQGQALACGCPVIATHNTGASDLFVDGQAGYIVPIRDVETLTDKIQKIADDPELRMQLSKSALNNVKSIGGWSQYGQTMMAAMHALL